APTAPPPRTRRRRGSVLAEVTSRLSHGSSWRRPSIGGMAALVQWPGRRPGERPVQRRFPRPDRPRSRSHRTRCSSLGRLVPARNVTLASDQLRPAGPGYRFLTGREIELAVDGTGLALDGVGRNRKGVSDLP